MKRIYGVQCDALGRGFATNIDAESLSGGLVESRVPWVLAVPRWHLSLFQHVRRHPWPSHSNAGSVTLDDEHRHESEMITALRSVSRTGVALPR